MLSKSILFSSQCVVKDVWTSSHASIRNPKHFVLLLVHDGHDLTAYVGQTAGLDDTCNRTASHISHQHGVVCVLV